MYHGKASRDDRTPVSPTAGWRGKQNFDFELKFWKEAPFHPSASPHPQLPSYCLLTSQPCQCKETFSLNCAEREAHYPIGPSTIIYTRVNRTHQCYLNLSYYSPLLSKIPGHCMLSPLNNSKISGFVPGIKWHIPLYYHGGLEAYMALWRKHYDTCNL